MYEFVNLDVGKNISSRLGNLSVDFSIMPKMIKYLVKKKC